MQGSNEIGAAMQRSCVRSVGCGGDMEQSLCCGTAAPLVPRHCNVTFGGNMMLLEPVLIQQHRTRVYLWAVVPIRG